MHRFIQYFVQRPTIANALYLAVIFLALFSWGLFGKEEMPEFAMERVRSLIRYPGASAEDVELFVTKPVEEKLKGISGIERIATTSSYGSSTTTVYFEPNIEDLQEKVQELKDAVRSADIPIEAEEPVFRQFKSSEKAIIDIAFYHQDYNLLDTKARQELQAVVLAFKNKILGLPEISGVEAEGYLRPELQIRVQPERLNHYETPLSQLRSEILQQNSRLPLGNLEDAGESEVTIVSELDTPEKLSGVVVSSAFQGHQVRLGQIARVEDAFQKTKSILKVQGHEGVILNIQKSSNVDILKAQRIILDFIRDFERANSSSKIKILTLDDESYDVRNRLSLISKNGIFGFFLILVFLFLLLDLRSSFWIAAGIPFSLAATALLAHLAGYTINNMTLAAVIIVLGIVVDDAIIVGENIIRQRRSDTPSGSIINSTASISLPVIASVLTTCAAFVPLYFFPGRLGLFVRYIPLIVCLMLMASLFESFSVLPSHLSGNSRFSFSFHWLSTFYRKRDCIVEKVEAGYARFLEKLLRKKRLLVVLFLIPLILSGIFLSRMHYVMFPREESRDIRVRAVAEENTSRKEMAQKVQEIEQIFVSDPHVIGVRTKVGQSHRGGEVKENEASIHVELLPPSEREKPLKVLLQEWESQVRSISGFTKFQFYKSRFGSDSETPIELEIRENQDSKRALIVEAVRKEMESYGLRNIEIERPIMKRTFALSIKADEAKRLGIDINDIRRALRAYVEGEILYILNSGEEEVDVKLTSSDEQKADIESVLNLTVANQEKYLVPLRQLVDMEEIQKPVNIERTNYARTTKIFAELPEDAKTPLQVAEFFEKSVFPRVLSGSPSTSLEFMGEIKDTRESGSHLWISGVLASTLIFLILVITFNSIWIPILIVSIVPFGVAGTIVAFFVHGFQNFGFFAVVGVLGMVGVIVNDAIVMIYKYQSDNMLEDSFQTVRQKVALHSASRLKAVVATTVTTVAGLFPTAYGWAGFDSMLAELMLAISWGLLLGLPVTLILTPVIYCGFHELILSSREGQKE